MYCPSCGFESAPGLQFCKRCGANLMQTAPLIVTSSRPPGLGFLIAFCVAMLGLPLPILVVGFAVINELLAKGARNGLLVMVAMVSLVVSASTVAVIGRVLNRLIGAYLQTGQQVQPRRVAPFIERPQMSAQPESIGSVTEHTTRTLAPKTDRVQ